jgi:hypothetical protein
MLRHHYQRCPERHCPCEAGFSDLVSRGLWQVRQDTNEAWHHEMGYARPEKTNEVHRIQRLAVLRETRGRELRPRHALAWY